MALTTIAMLEISIALLRGNSSPELKNIYFFHHNHQSFYLLT